MEALDHVTADSGPVQLPMVVVGVDGSEPSLRALRWAADYAQKFGAALEVVTAWTFPEQPAPLGFAIEVPFQEELMEQAEAKLGQIIADVLPEDRTYPLSHKVVRGSAAQVLTTEADHAALLVVGKQGHGTIEKLLVGSVSERCARRAPCAVAVIP